jgi:large subunit ribosomal protein L35e
MPKAAKPSELKTKSRADLLEELAKLEKKLFELRGQVGSSSSAEKLSAIRTTRKDVARVKTVLMEQQRNALREKYKDAKLVPKDIRPHTVKSRRNALPAKYANKLTKAAWRRAKFLKPVRFALKAA